MNGPANVNLVGITGITRRLVQDGALGEADARKAQDDSAREKLPIQSFLLARGMVSHAQVAAANSAEFGIPIVDVSVMDLTQMPVKLVEERLINLYKALPLYKRGNRLFVGISDPTNTRALDDIKFQANLTVEPILVAEDALLRVIEQALAVADAAIGGSEEDEGLENLDISDTSDDDAGGSGIDSKTDDTPVVRFVNKMLVDAIKKGASDVHFEPYETDYRVRVRMDGILRTVARPPVKLAPRIASRLKVMSSLDIAERRVPQDGRIKLNLSKTKSMDFRVSTCPTLFGEKIVLRILDGSAA